MGRRFAVTLCTIAPWALFISLNTSIFTGYVATIILGIEPSALILSMCKIKSTYLNTILHHKPLRLPPIHPQPAFTCSKLTVETIEICSKLTIKTPERRKWGCFGVFIINFEHISHLVLVFLLLTLKVVLVFMFIV